ncbi:ras GEF [Sistotremastrum suecicum HHB10207 ss-3]|uniref:Ras GEF n=1 Tax=Sistotremastrum suecicum HHB10207 ss-3 TaxID=1314776 RepID=A0A166HGF6_9AGAM|nr:ras GEF [Sistotremastrum suecicum HHB10207 ss-3]
MDTTSIFDLPHFASSSRVEGSLYSLEVNPSHTPSLTSLASHSLSTFWARCLFPFHSDDPSHLSIEEGETLRVLRKEENGWWGAEKDGKTGWFPAAYVKPVPLPVPVFALVDDLTQQLDYFAQETRRLHRTAPLAESTIASSRTSLASFETRSEDIGNPPDEIVPTNPSYRRGQASAEVTYHVSTSPKSFLSDDSYSDEVDSSARSSSGDQTSPVHGLPDLNKPVPPTPVTELSRGRALSRSRSDLSSARWPTRISTHLDGLSAQQPQLAVLTESLPLQPYPDILSAESDPGLDLAPFRARRSDHKIGQILGYGDAQAYYKAKNAQAALPWYLRPSYSNNELVVDNVNDLVQAGTLRALVERLTIEPWKPSHAIEYRDVFLLTLPTFATAESVYELLTDLFRQSPPEGLSEHELREWNERKLRPMQQKILQTFAAWVEQFGFSQYHPNLVTRLQAFVASLRAPYAAEARRTIADALDRIASDTPPPMISVPPKRSRMGKKQNKADILHWDPQDLAEQLTLVESQKYAQIQPRDCVAWTKALKQDDNLRPMFGALKEQLSMWVKTSILNQTSLGKRADTVERWIKVAERCTHVKNHNSVDAIVSALSSAVVSKLYLTWAHVKGHERRLDQLKQLVSPDNNYSNCRLRDASATTPCVPQLEIYLLDLKNVTKLRDYLQTSQGAPMINFTKCRRISEVISTMLRHQTKPYKYAEKTDVVSFIKERLQDVSDDATLATKSMNLQKAELAHADMKKNLEAAGF